MTQVVTIHPTHPERRRIRQVAELLRQGGVIAYPTDSSYALGCQIGEKAAIDRIRRIRGVDDRHHLTLVCRDLSELGTYARVDNSSYRLLKVLTPGPYTFILRATGEVPRRLVHPRRKTIGLRVPDHPLVGALLEALGEPLLSSTLVPAGEAEPLSEPEEIARRLGGAVDRVLDAGPVPNEPTTVVDLTGDQPEVLRRGRGDTRLLES